MSLQDDLREKAEQQRQIANGLIQTVQLIKQDADGKYDCQNLVSAIVGHVNATIYETSADEIDFLRLSIGGDSSLDRRRKVLERNDAIRLAAARGDWDEFDRLAAGGEIYTPTSGGDTGGNGA